MGWRMIVTFLASVGLSNAGLAATNIDIDQKHAWAENVGWITFREHDGANGARVLPTLLSGFIWSENVGWINLGDGAPGSGSAYANVEGADFGVNVDPVSGELFGLAWGENIGWINFDTRDALTSSGQQARVDFDAGRLRGYAWAANAGWINLDHSAVMVEFTWPDCGHPFADSDGDGDVDMVDFGGLQRCISASAVGIPHGCECFNRPEPPDFPRGDNDIDSDDLDAFTRCTGGPGIPASADCDG